MSQSDAEVEGGKPQLTLEGKLRDSDLTSHRAVCVDSVNKTDVCGLDNREIHCSLLVSD
jgi:hypothetical protein